MKCLARRVSPLVSSSPKEFAVVKGLLRYCQWYVGVGECEKTCNPGTCGSVIEGSTEISVMIGIWSDKGNVLFRRTWAILD